MKSNTVLKVQVSLIAVNNNLDISSHLKEKEVLSGKIFLEKVCSIWQYSNSQKMPVLFDNYYFIVLLVSNSEGVNIVFHESLLLRKQKKLTQKFENVQSWPLSSQWNKGEKGHKFFILTLLSGGLKRWNLSEAAQRIVKIKTIIFYFN